MPRQRRASRSTVRHRWDQVRSVLRCSFNHDIERGEWARFSRAGYQLLVTCATCLKQHYNLVRPNSTFSFHGDAEDVKARQAGGD